MKIPLQPIHPKSDFGLKVRWIAYFDLLGMNALIKKRKTHVALESIRNSVQLLKSKTDSFTENRVKTVWFSDSFLLYTENDSKESFADLEHIARNFHLNLIVRNIPSRGSIEHGEFIAEPESGIYVGPALVSAHNVSESQNWIGFVLCKSAINRLKEMELTNSVSLNYSKTYSVPINIDSKNSKIEGWPCKLGFAGSVNGENIAIKKLSEMRSRLTKNTNPKIIAKYNNSLDFLNSIYSQKLET